MNPDILRLIKLAIADGVITEKEREVILRKAEKLGEDPDEVELILDGELALIQKQETQAPSPTSKSNKVGEVIKCQSCGAPANSMNVYCAECGHEFSQKKAISSVKELNQILRKIEKEERAKPEPKGIFASTKIVEREMTIQRRMASAISIFPVPNTRKDMVEFLSKSAARSETKTVMQVFDGFERQMHNIQAKAWKTKCKEIIMKARFTMKDDPKTLAQIEKHAKQMKI